MNTEIINSFYA